MRRFECSGIVCLLGGLLAACGSSSTPPPPPPPLSGTPIYTNASNGSRSAAFDGTNFVVGLQSLDTGAGTTSIGAILVDPTGAAVGNAMILSNVGDSPSIACNATSCLMAWAAHDDLATDGALKGLILSSAGGALAAPGAVFIIQASATNVGISTDKYRLQNQSIAWDGNNFLVVYEHVHQPDTNLGPSTSDVLGQFVDTNGVTVGTPLQISNLATQKTGDETGQPVLAYDTNHTQSLVVWLDASSNTTTDGDLCSPVTQNMQYSPMDVDGQYVSQSSASAAGTPTGVNFPIKQDGLRKTRGGPTIATDGSYFLVVWNTEKQLPSGPCPNGQDPDDGPTTLAGDFVTSPNQTLLGTIAFGTASTAPGLPQAAHDPTSSKFMLVWTDFRNDANGNFVCDAGESTCIDIWGQSIQYDSLPSVETQLVSDAGNQFEGILGTGGGKLLLLWMDGAIAVNGSQSLTSPNTERALAITAP